MSPGSVRKVVGTPRFISGKLMGVFGGAIVKGMMLAGAKGGVPLLWKAIPCATIVVPWGIFASRETVGGSSGFEVAGTLTQIPGSIWMPAGWPFCCFTLASLNLL
jgi:hypothetical protein